MNGARTDQGLEFVLRPRGAGRFVGAGFLTFWLCGWAAGEAFAIGILAMGAKALLTGEPPGPGREPLAWAPALAAGSFLLVWLIFWTVGGLAAMRELLRLLWSLDRIVAGPATLRVLRHLGPFRSTLEIPRDTLRRIDVAPGDRILKAYTVTGPVDLSALGAIEEREHVAAGLRGELRVPEELEAEGTHPTLADGWQETITPEGEVALVADLGVRRKQAKVATVAALAAATVAMLLLRHTANDPNLIPLAVMACAAAAGIGWGALRLTRGRHEWRIGTGSLTQRWRFGGRVRDTFEAASLELTQSSDSDGDDWFALEAVAPGAAEFPAAARRRGRRTIARALRDPAVPKQVGRWLEYRARLPLADQTTREARAEEAQKALAQLRETGPFGRWAAGWLERLEAKRRGG